MPRKYLLFFSSLFCLIVTAETAFSSEALVVFPENSYTASRYSTWHGNYWSTRSTGIAAETQVKVQDLASSPQNALKVLAVMESTQKITVSTYTAALGWKTPVVLATAPYRVSGATYTKCFDITFENSSGRAMAVYSVGVSSPAFSVLGSTWSTPVYIPGATTNGIPLWIKLASKPGANEVIAVVHYSDEQTWAHVWNGSVWGNAQKLSTSTASSDVYDAPCMDVCYESSSGDAIVMWGDGTNFPKYRIWNGSWGAQTAMSDHGWYPIWIKMAADPDSDAILLATCNQDHQVIAEAWNGSAWGNVQTLTTSAAGDFTIRPFDVVYSKYGNYGMVVWAVGGETSPRYRAWNGTSWETAGIGSSFGRTMRWVYADADPFGDDVMILASSNDSNDDYTMVQRYNGSGVWGDVSEFGHGGGNTQDRAIVYVQYASSDVTPPERITGLSAVRTNEPNTIQLSWVATGDDDYRDALASGSEYKIQYSTSAPSAVTWSTAAAQITIPTESVNPGVVLSTTIAGLMPFRQYYYRIWAMDEAYNWSVHSATTSAASVPFTLSAIDTAGDVGKYSDIAIDDSGNIHISYYDATQTALKYSKYAGSWSTETVRAEATPAGMYSSIDLDVTNRPHIAYQMSNMGDNETVMYSYNTGSSWTHKNPTDDYYRNGSGSYANMRLDNDGRPWMIYYGYDGDLSEARQVFRPYDEWAYGQLDAVPTKGQYTSLDLDYKGTPHISFQNSSKLYYGTMDTPQSWAFTEVDATATNGGLYTSIKVDGNGRPHIVYFNDNNTYTVRYAYYNGSTWSLENIQAVGDGGGAGQTVYRIADLALDADGNPHVVYYHMNNADLMYAWKDGEGWHTTVVDATGNVGNYCAIAISPSGDVNISYYDATNGDLKYAVWQNAVSDLVTRPLPVSASSLYTSSVTWNWSNVSNENAYVLLSGDQNRYYNSGFYNYTPFTIVADTTTLPANTVSYDETSLTPNTRYQRMIAAVNAGGVKYSTSTFIYTLANPSTGTYIVDISTGFVQLAWFRDSNPIDTFYEVSRSTNNFNTSSIIKLSSSSFASSTVFIDTTTLPGTTYYYRIRARNHQNLYTAYDTIVSTYTTPLFYKLVTASAYTHISYSRSDCVLDVNGYPHACFKGGMTSLTHAYHNGSNWVAETAATTVNDSFTGYASMALDSDGRANIAYIDESGSDYILKFTKYNGATWDVSTIDTAGSGLDCGLGLDLAMDGSDNTHISYQSYNKLKYAYFNGVAWSTTTVTTMSSGLGQSYPRTAIAVDGLGRPQVIYYNDVSGTMRYAAYDGSQWNDSEIGAYGAAPKLDIVLSSTGTPHIVFTTSTVLQYGYLSGSTWVFEPVSSDASHVTLALTAEGIPHIAYRDGSGRIMYAKKIGGVWISNLLDFRSQNTSPSIKVDSDGYPHITYYNSAQDDFYYATIEGDVAKYARSDGPGLGPAVAAPILSASNITATSIDYSWTNVENETGYELIGGTSTPYSVMTTKAANDVTYTESSLTPNKYCPRFVRALRNSYAVNSNPTLKYTLANPCTGSYIVSSTSFSATLGWFANANPPYTRYEILRSLDNFASTTTLKSFANNYVSTTYTDASLAQGVQYYYKVRAVNQDNTPAAYDILVSTITPDQTPPAPVTGLAAYVNFSSTTVSLDWVAPGNNGSTDPLSSGSAFYIQYSSNAPEGVSWGYANAQIAVVLGSAVNPGVLVSTKAYNLQGDTDYWFKVWAKDNSGNYSVASNTATVRVGYATVSQILNSNNGAYTSIAVRNTANPNVNEVHVSYASLGDLVYHKWNGSSWSTENVDTLGTISYNKIVLDSSGYPHIIYYRSDTGDLKYAKWDGTTWSKETAISTDDVGQFCSLALDSKDRPHVVFYDNQRNYYRYAMKNGSGWGYFSGTGGTTWNATYPGDGMIGYPVLTVGADPTFAFNGIAVDPTGKVHMAMRDSTAGSLWLKYRVYNGFIDTADNVDTSATNGQYASLALDPNGVPHVAYYYDGSSDALRYAKKPGSKWISVGIDTAAAMGMHTSIKLDGAGRPVISYYDGTNADLELARYTGTAWVKQTLDSTNDRGSYTSLALDGMGNYHIAYMDVTGTDMRYIKSNGAGYTPVVFAPRSLAATQISTCSVVYTWQDTSHENGYRLYDIAKPYAYVLKASSATLAANAVTYTETGLAANTTYYRVITAVNSGTYANSNAITFVTLTAAPTGSYILTRTSDTVTFSWAANTNGSHTVWGILRSTNNFATSQEISGYVANHTVTSYTDTGLAPQTTYYYKVRAYSVTGVPTDYDVVVSTRTRKLSPSAPSGFGAVAVSTTSVKFTWTDNASSEDGFRLYTAADALAATVIENTTFYIQPGLAANTSSYIWKVRAFNDESESNAILLSSIPFSAANPAGAVAFSNVTMTRISLSWQANSNPSYTRWKILRSTDNFGTSHVVKDIADDFTATNITQEGLLPGTSYSFKIGGYNQNGLLSNYSAVYSTRTISVPNAPTAFAGTALSSTTIRYTWTDNSNNEWGFRIYNSTGGFLVQVDTNTVAYSVTGLTANTSYYAWSIRAFQEAESSSSTLASIVFSSANAPVNVYVTSVGTNTVTVNWSPNGNSSVTQYSVDVSTDSLGYGNPINSGWVTGASYAYSALTPNVTYYAKVTARNGNSINSGFAVSGATVTLANPPVFIGYSSVSTSTIKLNWSANANHDSTSYVVVRSTRADFSVMNQTLTNTTFYIVSGLTPNSTYWFKVLARNHAGTLTSITDCGSKVTLARAPASLVVLSKTESSISLDWAANNNPSYTRWVLLRSADNFASTTTVKSFASDYTQTEYNDTTLDSGATYWYKLAACNDESVLSGYVMVSTRTTLIPYTIEVVEALNLQQGSTRMAVDKNGTKHIVYTPGSPNTTLRYAKNTGAGWQFSDLVTGAASNIGDITIEAAGNGDLHVLYVVMGVLRHLYYDASEGAWTSPSIVDSGINWYPELFIKEDGMNKLHTVYTDGSGNLKYACNNGIAWSTSVVAGITNSGSSCMDLGPDGRLFIAYILNNGENYVVNLTTGVNGAWSTPQTISAAEEDIQNVSIAVDSLGAAHVSYRSRNNILGVETYKVKYIKKAGTVVTTSDVVTKEYDENTLWEEIDKASGITLDGGGVPHIMYSAGNYESSVSSYTLVNAYKNGGSWQSYTVELSTQQIDMISIARGIDGKNNVSYRKQIGANATQSGLYYALGTGVPGTVKMVPPASFSATGVYVTSASWSWSAVSGAMGYNLYNADALPYTLIAGTTTLSSATLNYTETGIASNSNLKRYIQAVNPGTVASLAASATSYYTLANAPLSLAVVARTASGITLDWNENGNSAGTRYGIQGSTNNFASYTTAVGYNNALVYSSYTVIPLSSDTTYYFRVLAYNHNAVPSAYSSTVSTKTLSEGIAPNAVSTLVATEGTVNGEILLSWNATGDDAATGDIVNGAYKVQYSTYPVSWNMNNAQITVSTSMAAGSAHHANILALAAGSTYYIRMWISDEVPNWSPLSNGATAQARVFAPFGPLSFTSAALSTTTIQWNWADNSTLEQGYRVRDALNSGTIVTTLPANTTFWRQAGLTPNILQSLWVEAYNTAGSSATDTQNRYTRANAAHSLAQGTVTYNSIVLSWSANSNPLGTRYEILRSTTAFANSTTTVKGYSDAFSSTTFTHTGLMDQTSYYFKVRAFNGEGTATAYTSMLTQMTHPAAPVMPAAFSALPLSTGSLCWVWNDIPKESGYKVYTSTGFLITTLPANTTNWVESGLSANTARSRYVQSYNVTGSSASAVITKYTHASAPSQLLISSRTYNSVYLSWSANINPAGTRFGVIRSTDAFATSTATLKGFGNNYTDTYYTDSSLSAENTYYYKLVAYNGDATPTAYSAMVSTITPAGPPTAPLSFIGTALSPSSIRWNWLDTQKENGYRIYTSTNGLLTFLSPNTTFWIESGFTVNTQHARYVLAYNESGSSATVAVAVYTQANIPASPVITGKTYSSASLAWSANGNVPGTRYGIVRSTCNFAVPAATIKAYADNLSTTTYTDSALESETSYYYKILAYNTSGSSTAYSAVISTFTNPVIPPVVSGFSANALSSTTIDWFWQDGVKEAGYRIYSSTYGILANLPANTTHWLETGLAVNTTQYRIIESYNISGSLSPVGKAKCTLANAPASSRVMGKTYSSVSLQWSQNSNPDGTRYGIVRSTDNAVFSTLVGFSNILTTTTYTNSPVESETTYYYKIFAYNHVGTATAYDTTVSTLTPAGPPNGPLGFIGTAIATGTIRWNWLDNSTKEAGYRVLNSTGGIVKNLGANTTFWIEAGRSINTQYTRYALAYNVSGSSASTSASCYTLANKPQESQITARTYHSISMSWSDNANSAGTHFGVVRSTSPTGVFVARRSFADNHTTTSYTDTSLVSESTYYYKVFAYNHAQTATDYDILVSTLTYPAPPYAALSFTGTALSTGSIVWSWVDNTTKEEGYRVLGSTGGIIKALPINTTAWIEQGLATNNQYTRFIQVYNVSGSSATTAVSKYTLAKPPTAAGITNRTYATISLSWGSNGNPAGTRYAILRSVDNFAASTTTVKSFADAFSATALTDTGLDSETTYYYKVVAFNGNSILTNYTLSVNTVTFAGPPLGPTNFTGTVLSTASIKWSWVDNTGKELGYRVLDSAESIVASLPPNTTYWIETGFVANTQYTRMVQVYNVSGSSNTAALSKYTLASPPSVFTFSAVNATVVSLAWSQSSASVYIIERSNAVSGPWNVIVTTNTLSYTDTSLNADTMYYYRIGSKNAAGAASGLYSVAAATRTLPGSLDGAAGAARDTVSIVWAWSSPTQNVIGVRVYASSSTAVPLATISAPATSWLETNLSPNTRYTRYLSAYNSTGEGAKEAVSRYTLTTLPYNLVMTTVTMHEVGLSWQGEATGYSIKRSSGASWTTRVSSFTRTAWKDRNLRYATTYYYAVYGYNGDGIVTANAYLAARTNALPSTVSLIVTTATVTQEQKATDPVVGEIKVYIPTGTITIDGYITINTDADTTPTEVTKADLDTSMVSLGINTNNKILASSIIELNLFDVNGSTVSMTFAEPLTLVMSYPDADNDGFVDGTFPRMRGEALRIFTLNKTTLEWEKVSGDYTHNGAAKTVAVKIYHFSVYALVGVQSFEQDLAGVLVYPNPYKPGDPSQGDTTFGTGIVFSKLTEHAVIKIFNIAGELVTTLNEENSDGYCLWNAANSDGEKVASGVYIYIMTNPQGEKKAGKVSIIK